MFLYILATNNPKNKNLNIFHERTKEDKILRNTFSKGV